MKSNTTDGNIVSSSRRTQLPVNLAGHSRFHDEDGIDEAHFG